MSKMYFLPFRPAFDSAGITVPGSQHWFTLAGTNTPSAPFTDAGLTIPHQNPVVSDGIGYLPPIYLDPGISYRVRIYDENAEVGVDTPLEEYDPYVPALSGTDIFSDLADTDGASLIGLPGGGTVEDASFVKGNAVYGVGSAAVVSWKREPSSPTYSLSSLGGLWPLDKVTWNHAISAEFDATNAPASGASQSPSSTLLLAAHNKGTLTTTLALQTITGVHSSSKEGAGVNFITYADAGLTNVKMKGLEIDIQPAATTTIADSFGIALNAFTKEVGGEAVFIEGVSGGSWSTGIRIGKLNSSAGAGIYGAGQMGTLLDTATGTYGQDAVCFANGHKLRFRGTGSTHAKVYNHSDDNLRIVLGAAGLLVRDSTDATSLFSVTSGGFGYPTGVGGTVTQATSKSTAVTLNKIVGQITMNNAALAANTEVSFVFNNSMIGANDFVYSMPVALIDKYDVRVGNTTTPGQCSFVVKNVTGGSLSEALVIGFIVFKGAVV